MIVKNVVFWDVALCRSCVNRRFRGTYRLHLQGRKIRERRISVARWLQSAIRSSETSVNTRPTQRHIPEDDILHSHRCESLKSYKNDCDGEGQLQLIINRNRNWLTDFRTLLHGISYLELQRIVDMIIYKAQILTSEFYGLKA
jgi:hypothetical protein